MRAGLEQFDVRNFEFRRVAGEGQGVPGVPGEPYGCGSGLCVHGAGAESDDRARGLPVRKADWVDGDALRTRSMVPVRAATVRERSVISSDQSLKR